MDLDSDTLLPSELIGGEISRLVSVAFFSLLVYEWLITLANEVEYFWSGKWTLTRCLFLLNRYFVLFIGVIDIISVTLQSPSQSFCRPIVPFLFISNSIAISIIQAILVIRVWHLFSNNRKIQIMIIAMFGTSVVLAMGFTIDSAVRIRFQSTGVVLDKLRILGCRADRPHKFWRIYLPSLCLHTVLYALTAVRALRNRRTLKHAPVLKRLLRDGGFFYFVVFVSVGVSTVGSFMEDFAQLNVVVAYSNYLVAINSIAVARVMLSIHSLAARLGSDTAWLLNNVELSRVGWRQGRTEGELIVERWCDDVEEIELRRRSTVELLKTSTVGVYNGAWLD